MKEQALVHFEAQPCAPRSYDRCMSADSDGKVQRQDHVHSYY